MFVRYTKNQDIICEKIYDSSVDKKNLNQINQIQILYAIKVNDLRKIIPLIEKNIFPKI